jgi:predicted nucleic-acid-binding Zn-ribbon protein
MPTFETSEGNQNVISLLPILSSYFKVKFELTPRFFPADLVDISEKIYIEIRCRNCQHNRFSEFIISATKWVELLRLTFDELSPEVYLCVSWTDGIGLLKLEFGKVNLVPFKRAASKGTRSEDVMISIPVSYFKIEQELDYGLKLPESNNITKSQANTIDKRG